MYFFGYFLVSLFFCVTANRPIDHDSINTLDETNFADVSYRLPNNTIPINYDITLATNVDKGNFTFDGKVIIGLLVQEEGTDITIHARQLNIIEVALQTSTGSVIRLNDYKYDTTTEFLTIPAKVSLTKGANYLLTIKYWGELREDMGGFYRSSYVNSKGEKKQVQPHL